MADLCIIERLDPGTIANEMVITGQSQGSASSIGASRIAPTYASELKLRATIATGVLPEFPEGPIKLPELLGGMGTTRYTMLRLVGGSLRDGEPSADELVNDQARPLLTMARETCGDGIRAYEQQHGIDMRNAFTVAPTRLTALMLPATEMSMVRMPAPLFLGTGLADRTIPPQHQYAAAAALCAAGNPLAWKTYPGITHNGGVNAAFDDELAFVNYWTLHRFAFTPSLRRQYAAAIRDHWEFEKPEKFPIWNFIQCGCGGGQDCDAQGAVWTLRGVPSARSPRRRRAFRPARSTRRSHSSPRRRPGRSTSSNEPGWDSCAGASPSPRGSRAMLPLYCCRPRGSSRHSTRSSRARPT